MKKWMILLGVLAPYISFSSPPWHSYSGNNLVWSIAGGPAWSSSGLNQEWSNYNTSDETRSLGVGELFIGAYRELNHAVQGQFGVEVAYGGNVGFSGRMMADDLPLNTEYQYQVYQVRVGGKAKLVLVDFPTTSMIQPYVAVGMGVGFNQSINYQLTPPISQNLYPVFSNKSVSAFTYNAGGGIQIPVNPFMQLGLGYEYANWGKSSLGEASGLSSLLAPTIDSISVNTILISLTYTA